MLRPTLRLYDGTPSTSPQLKEFVEELQTLLKDMGYRIRVDGVFGPYTEAVLKLFQASQSILNDGVAGPKTWAYLLQEAPPEDMQLAFQTSYATWDKHLLQELEELKKYEAFVKKAAQVYSIPASVLAAIGALESRWGLALSPPGSAGTGDGGHGRGLMQIDDRWHVPFIQSGKWVEANENIAYGAAVLKNSIDYIGKQAQMDMSQALLRAGIAGYNCGPARALQALRQGLDVDYYTARRNYSQQILNRAGWFQLHGWD